MKTKRDEDGVLQRFFGDLRDEYRDYGEEAFIFQYFKEKYETEESHPFYNALTDREQLEPLSYLTWLFESLSERKNERYYRDVRCDKVYDNLLLLCRDLLALEDSDIYRVSGKGGLVLNRHKKTEVGRYIKRILEGIKAGDREILSRIQAVEKEQLASLKDEMKNAVVHIQVKTYLRDSGCPVREKSDGNEDGAFGKRIRNPNTDEFHPRKTDFTMRLFSAFCASENGYIVKKWNEVSLSGQHVSGNFYYFCDKSEVVDELMNKLKKREEGACAYVPLVIDLLSGCIFGIFGKEWYGASAKDSPNCCYDYLEYVSLLEEDRGQSEKPLPPYNLKRAFPEGVSYQEALERFETYCRNDDTRKEGEEHDSGLELLAPYLKIQEQNGFIGEGIPIDFMSFFDLQMDAADDFVRTRQLVKAKRELEEKKYRTNPKASH